MNQKIQTNGYLIAHAKIVARDFITQQTPDWKESLEIEKAETIGIKKDIEELYGYFKRKTGTSSRENEFIQRITGTLEQILKTHDTTEVKKGKVEHVVSVAKQALMQVATLNDTQNAYFEGIEYAIKFIKDQNTQPERDRTENATPPTGRVTPVETDDFEMLETESETKYYTRKDLCNHTGLKKERVYDILKKYKPLPVHPNKGKKGLEYIAFKPEDSILLSIFVEAYQDRKNANDELTKFYDNALTEKELAELI